MSKDKKNGTPYLTKPPREDTSEDLPVVYSLGLAKSGKGFVVVFTESQGVTILAKEVVSSEPEPRAAAVQRLQIEAVRRFVLGKVGLVS